MLKLYFRGQDLLARLRSDRDGVVSFEYVIVAACIVAAVFAAFGNTANTGIGAALSAGITKITTYFTTTLSV